MWLKNPLSLNHLFAMRHPHSTAPAAQSNTEVQLFTWGVLLVCLNQTETIKENTGSNDL